LGKGTYRVSDCNRIFDLQIALCAFESGARELWSYDARFVTVPGLPY
jgi:hypothetical protein